MKNALMDFTLNQKVPQKKISELEHGSREISKAEMQRGFFYRGGGQNKQR